MSWSTKKPAVSFEDYLELTALMFNWGDSYDAKDWTRLRSIIAPTLLIDYRLVMDDRWRWDAMLADDFVRMISDDGFLGDPLVKTQHLLGATEWERISDTEVIGHHQLRAAHLRFTGPDMQRVDRRGHSHATNEHFYKKVDGVWKFAGLRPTVRWNEYDFEKIFKGISFDTVASAVGEKAESVESAAAVASAVEGGVGVGSGATLPVDHTAIATPVQG